MATTVNFIDYIKVQVRSGHGGAGSVHFRREKFVAKGGPDGGDGGRGGHVIFVGNPQLSTLFHLRYKKHLVAEAGQAGARAKCTGADGVDVVVEVPLGTVVKEADSQQFLFDITQAGQEVVVAQGGKGGWGNVHFVSPTRQTPRYAQPGQPGQEKWVTLELKLLADVGVVGLPNAGKSTLLSVVSAAKPKIAAYPFTTLVPQLGVVAYRDNQSFVMADMPGIIDGAAQGKGLGFRFLRHIERSAVLLLTVDAITQDIPMAYTKLLEELHAYDPALLERPRLLALTKIDLLPVEARQALSLPAVDHVAISSTTQEGIGLLKDKLWSLLSRR